MTLITFHPAPLKIPSNWLAINDPDISFILMNLETEKVYRIAPLDYERLFKDEKLECPHDVFDNFIDFFAFLLDEEEEL